MMCLRVLERVRFNNITTFFRPSNELPDREITAKSVPSKTLNRRERRGTQRKHILGFSAVGAATYKTSAYLCALCGKKSFKVCYVSVTDA